MISPPTNNCKMPNAIPTTPLYDRLKREQRLNDPADSARYGTNVVPLGMSRDDLREGLIDVTREAYAPDAYFRRLDALFLQGGFKFAVHGLPYWRNHRTAWMLSCIKNYIMFAVLAGRLIRNVKSPELRAKYRSQLSTAFRTRPWEPQLLFTYAVKTAMHYHYTSITDALGSTGSGPLPAAVRSFSRAKTGAAVSLAH